VGAKKFGLKVVHFSLQSNHFHLVVEAATNAQLSRGMKSINVSFSKSLNALLTRKGSVFVDRYFMHILKTPLEVRNAIRYVLTNSSKHQRCRVFLDQFSSGVLFGSWRALLKSKRSSRPLWNDFFEVELIMEADAREEYGESIYAEIKGALSKPTYWLTHTGWKQAS
jgi:hypothetical protein